MMKQITVKSPAKINLSLDVLGKMENGYHEISTVMQMTELHDDVKVVWKERAEDAPKESAEDIAGEPAKGAAEENGGAFQIRINAGGADIPEDSSNIAYRAAAVMRERYRPEAAGILTIAINKRIPVAAGLAGGSGNGASVVLAINALWELGLTMEELMAAGGQLGADVPFSVMGTAAANAELGFGGDYFASPCALAEGTGTRLTPLPALKLPVVLSKPDIPVSTAEVYAGIDRCRIDCRPDISEQICGIRDGDIELIKKNMVNVLEIYTLKRYDKVMYTKNKMQKLCTTGAVLMSGSGPTVFAVTEDEHEADRLYDSLAGENRETFKTFTLG